MPAMRVCAKMRCSQEPVATVSLVYTGRMVVVHDLFDERDPNLLDLCPEHVRRIVAEGRGPSGRGAAQTRDDGSVLWPPPPAAPKLHACPTATAPAPPA